MKDDGDTGYVSYVNPHSQRTVQSNDVEKCVGWHRCARHHSICLSFVSLCVDRETQDLRSERVVQQVKNYATVHSFLVSNFLRITVQCHSH
jgi:hypothetical protein